MLHFYYKVTIFLKAFYLLLAIKNFKKQKLFSIINILGLTVGITCCMMIFLFILNEFSFDKFHKNGKDIYRIYRVGETNGEKRTIPWVSAPYGPALANDYPDAVKATLRVQNDNDLVTYKNVSFNEQKISGIAGNEEWNQLTQHAQVINNTTCHFFICSPHYVSCLSQTGL